MCALGPRRYVQFTHAWRKRSGGAGALTAVVRRACRLIICSKTATMPWRSRHRLLLGIRTMPCRKCERLARSCNGSACSRTHYVVQQVERRQVQGELLDYGLGLPVSLCPHLGCCRCRLSAKPSPPALPVYRTAAELSALCGAEAAAEAAAAEAAAEAGWR